MQVKRRLRLASQSLLQPLQPHPIKRSTATHARRMNHRVQRMLRRQRPEQLNELRTITHITRHHTHNRTETLKLTLELHRALRSRTTTTHQNEMPSPQRRKPTRDMSTQTPHTASNQHRAPRPPHALRSTTTNRRPRQTPRKHTVRAHRELVLLAHTTKHSTQRSLRTHI